MHCWSKNWTMEHKSYQIPYINLFNRHKNQNKIFVLPFWNILTVLVSTFRCLENVWILPHSSGFSFHLIWGTIYESQCQIQIFFLLRFINKTTADWCTEISTEWTEEMKNQNQNMSDSVVYLWPSWV